MAHPEQLPQRLYRNGQRRASRGSPVDRASEGYVHSFCRDQRRRYHNDDDDSSSWDYCVDDPHPQSSDYAEEVYYGQCIVRNLCVALSVSVEGLTLRYLARIITFQCKEAPGT